MLTESVMDCSSHQVRLAQDQDCESWNRFLSSQPGNSPLGRYEWRGILEETYGVQTDFLLSERDGQITGLLAGYRSRDILGQIRHFTTRAGFWPANKEAGEALMAALTARLEPAKSMGAEITSYVEDFGWEVSKSEKTTVQIPLSGDEEALWSSLRDKTRNMIRRARRDGVTVSRGHAYVDVLYQQYRDNMLRLGVRIHSKSFFEHVLEKLGGETEILVAEWNGKIIASMMLHYGNQVACYPVQNAGYDYRKLAPIQILNWEAMLFAARQGAGYLDMGESAKGSPVYKSKVNFGGLPNQFFAYHLDGNCVGSRLPRPFQAGIAIADTYCQTRAPSWLRLFYAEWKSGRGRLL